MKRYIRSSYEYEEEDDYFEDLPDDDGGGVFVVELYEDKYEDPIRKYFRTGKKALDYAKRVIAKYGDRFESIYINVGTVNGPFILMVYENGKWRGDSNRLEWMV